MKRLSILLTLLILGILLAPCLGLPDPITTDANQPYEQPSAQHWLGTDQLGRDILSRTLYGGRQTFLVAGLATLIAIGGGVLLGILTTLPMPFIRYPALLVTRFLFAFPSILLALLLLTLIGRGAFSIAIAAGVMQISFFAHQIRANATLIQKTHYVESAYALGATHRHIIRHHILPNLIPILRTYSILILSYCIINTASLSLLGFGEDPSIPEWGSLLSAARTQFRLAPWTALAPAGLLLLLLMSLNRLADRQH